MNMKDVKEITIPQGSVKKIEDSNGNVIWGSQTEFPYRRLEYIHFNGTDNYLVTRDKPLLSRFFYLQVKLDSDTGTNSALLSSNGDSTTNGSMRCNHNVNNGNMRVRWGRNSASDLVLGTFNFNHKYELRHRTYDVTYRHWMSFYDMDTSTDTGNYYNTNNSTYTYTPNNMCEYTLMCWVGNNVTPTPQANTYAKGNVYRFYSREGADTDPITYNCYPCQRKSDGMCGLLDTVTKVFYPMSGTVNASSAGPLVDEYWDLTAPS